MKANTVLTPIILFLIFILIFPGHSYAGIPENHHVMVTDVTPVSFSVIWASSEACTSNIIVFLDEEGNEAATGIAIVPQPVNSGDMSIAVAAEDNGVMKVRVTGLAPDTAYYFQMII